MDAINNNSKAEEKDEGGDIKEQHREAFNASAFGIYNSGKFIEDNKGLHQLSKATTKDEWDTIVQILSRWKTKGQLATLSALDQQKYETFRQDNIDAWLQEKKQFYRYFNTYAIEEDMLNNGESVTRLVRIEKGRDPAKRRRLVIPILEVFDVIYDFHSREHMGIERTQRELSETYYSISQLMVTSFIELCQSCNQRKHVPKKAKDTNESTNYQELVKSKKNIKRKAAEINLSTACTSLTRRRKGGKRRERFDDLFSTLPRSANVIDSNSMVDNLPDEMKQHLKSYIVERCPGSAEIVDILFWVSEQFPEQLRTKELCETLESVTLIGADINALLSKERDPNGNRRKTMTIYDLACGHGLGGLLLSYRFSFLKVVCIDRVERPSWSSYRAAFEKYGKKARKDDCSVMKNISYIVGDITDGCFEPKSGDYFMCLHGCNELTPFTLSKAQIINAGYAIMPCCLRDGMLGVTTTSSNNNWGIENDTARYSIQVGYLAGKFGVGKVATISELITNRFLILIGDYWNADNSC